MSHRAVAGWSCLSVCLSVCLPACLICPSLSLSVYLFDYRSSGTLRSVRPDAGAICPPASNLAMMSSDSAIGPSSSTQMGAIFLPTIACQSARRLEAARRSSKVGEHVASASGCVRQRSVWSMGVADRDAVRGDEPWASPRRRSP